MDLFGATARRVVAGSWLESRRFWEATAALSIVAVAAGLRLERLGSVPYGITGDEATFGLEGRRILHEGWIGPYSPYAAGQPAGVLYLGAVSLEVFGETIFAIRLVPALAGILTVAALYGVVRRHFGAGPALIAAALLAVSSWHIHLSRFAVPVAVWPLLGILTLGALLEALRGRSSWWWWAAAGALAGLGVYVYDAHVVFCVVLLAFVGGTMVVRRRDLRRYVLGAAVMAVAFLVVAAPMIRYVATHTDEYLGHARYNSIVHQPDWRARHGAAAHARFLVRRYVDYWDRLCCSPRVDGIDGTGLAALAPPAMLALAGYGMCVGLYRRRGPPVVLGIAVVLVMPLASVLSEGGVGRRAFVTLPILAMFAGVGAADLYGTATPLRRRLRIGAAVALALVLSLLAYQGLDDYFGKVPGSATESFVFGRPMTDASFFMRRLPPDRHIYFSSSAASVTHETRRFLAPDVVAEDRSREFGGNYSFAIAGDGRVPVFILLDAYEQDIERVRRLHPGGRTIVVGDPAVPEFIAYLAPG